MQTIEDALLHANGLPWPTLSAWERGFLGSVCDGIDRGRALSQRQVGVALRILTRLQPALADAGQDTRRLTGLIARPAFRQEPYVSTVRPREMRSIGRGCVALRFKYDPELSLALRGLNQTEARDPTIWYEPENRLWVVQVTPRNLTALLDFCAHHKFDVDAATHRALSADLDRFGEPSAVTRADDTLHLTVLHNPLLADWATLVAGGVE